MCIRDSIYGVKLHERGCLGSDLIDRPEPDIGNEPVSYTHLIYWGKEKLLIDTLFSLMIDLIGHGVYETSTKNKIQKGG